MSMISKQIDDLRAYAKDRKGELAKLINDAAFTIELLSAKQPEQRWIPVTENLPEEMAVVLVYTSVGGYFTAYFDGICWYHAGLHMMRIYSDVVAWMPLPPAYHADEESNA